MHKFIELCTLFEKLESLQSRNDMSLELSNFLKRCKKEEVEIISYLIQGRVAPMFVKAEFNYSEKSLINLLSDYISQDIFSLRKESGDIGNTVYSLCKERKNKGRILKTKEVYEVLWEIINIRGIGSVKEKSRVVYECFKNLNPLESKYFVRILCGQLRLGLSSRTLLDVFSIAVTGDKGLKKDLERAYGVCADIGYIGKKVINLKENRARLILSKVSATPGTPILSRLVQRVGSFEEISKRFNEDVLVQPKFDGLRCQIHKWKEQEVIKEGVYNPIWKKYFLKKEKASRSLFEQLKDDSSQVRLFTRNLEDVTEMFPEIVESAKQIREDSFILDSEIVGWNYDKEGFLSYQETMQRRRKYSITKIQKEIPVKAFVFDTMYLNGKSLIDVDTHKRIELMKGVLIDASEEIILADTKRLCEEKEIREYFEKNIVLGLEGIIVKQLEGGYNPGQRNYEWIKVKKSMEKDLVDTIDMVIVGYDKGSGRRSSFGLGAILGAIYNRKEDTFDAICKIGTGMSDEVLKEMSTKLSEVKMKEKPKNVNVIDSLEPDIWILPKYIITVDADEITKNISKKGKLIGGGLSLRFPRLMEFNRDKGVEDITTVYELKEMFGIRKK
jgi:DNA ligase 1